MSKLNIEFKDSDTRMPVLFVGHGNPMNAIEDSEFSRAWEQIGKQVPQPTAILCVSAHWLTQGTQVTGMENPKTIHDFGGFPAELYAMQYPAPGSPELARLACDQVKKTLVKEDFEWGLDHGTWAVLCRMFPAAKIPVVQLSIDYTREPQYHYELAQELKRLRNQGVLIIGSGNIVHNLRMAQLQDIAFDWALEFDEKIKDLILANKHSEIVHYEKLGAAARMAIPTNDHYLPLLYTLGLKDDQDQVKFFTDRVTGGSLSMRSVWLG